MANAQAMINEGLWRKDRDFQRLPRMAQCTFCQVLSQKDLDTAGVLTLHLELLAKACDELTAEQLRADFAVLEDRRFLFVDYDTDELLVRSYVRNVSATSIRNNAWRSVPKNARLLGSEKLRHELAVELRRLRWKEADALADEIDPVSNLSQPPSDPLATPFGKGTPFEGDPNPHSQVQVLAPVSPSVVGLVGEAPRPNCSKHSENHDGPCDACRRRREWDDTHESRIAADELDRKRRLKEVIAACPLCDQNGMVEVDNGLVRCECQAAHHA